LILLARQAPHCSATAPFGKPSGCCPQQAEFWRLGCTAGARLVKNNACEIKIEIAFRKEIGAVAGNCTRWWPCASTSVAGRHSAVKSQPRKLKEPGEASPSRPSAISTKNKHLLAIYSIPARGFTAVLSVFRGTPPPKPFDCKIWSSRAGACPSDAWIHLIG
jgi:hypothetical protein